MADPPRQLTHDDVMRLCNRGRLDAIERAAWHGRLRDVQREMQTVGAWHEHDRARAADDDEVTS
jgi:hypothetical protein